MIGVAVNRFKREICMVMVALYFTGNIYGGGGLKGPQGRLEPFHVALGFCCRVHSLTSE